MNSEAKEEKCLDRVFLRTRASLLERLKHSSADDSWSEFFNLYWKLIYNAARAAGLSDWEAQEVVQLTMIKLAKYLRAFRYDRSKGTFKAWLMTQTHCRIVDQFRKRRTDHDADVEALQYESFEQDWDREWKQNQINIALEAARKQLSSAKFQIYDFCVLQGQGAARTANALGISRVNVWVTVHRVNRVLRQKLSFLRSESE